MTPRNPLLYGRDNEERIVGIHQHDDASVRVYTRHSEDYVDSRVEPFSPFAFFTEKGYDVVARKYVGHTAHRLKGGMDYTRLLVFNDWRTHWQAVNAIRKDDDLKDEVYYISSPIQQYLMQTGKTMYLGMTLDDIVRLQVDIEVYSSTGAFPLAEREGDRVFMIQLSDNFGFEKVMHLAHDGVDRSKCEFEVESFETESDLLRAFIREIHRRDPDVLEMHNGLAFDLPYLWERCKLYGIDFAIGRDSQEPRSWNAQKKFAERDVEYLNAIVSGRSLTDTMFLSLAYDVFTRELPNATLKGVSEHFRQQDGLTFEDMHGHPRTYIAGENISQVWDEDPMRIVRYGIDDVRETRYLADKLAGATYYLSQMVPMTYQETHLSGSGKIIENIMVRQYVTSMHSLPKPQIGFQEWGGYTDIFYTGRFRNLIYADVASLYPSIMLKYRYHPKSDVLGVHRSMLQQLTDLRLEVKAQAKAAKNAGNDALAGVLKATEQSYKVIINSCYGVMGDKWSLFNDFDMADNVAKKGQELLKRMITIIEGTFGGTVIECDTDGVLYTCREELHGDLDAQEAEVEKISELMPEGINIDMDGLFDVMISYRKKNYALRDYKGKVKTKGGAFKNRGIEAFGREYQAELLSALMDGDVQKMHQIHERWKERITTGDWTVEDFEKRATLKESIAAYQKKLDDPSLRHNHEQAQYEIAKQMGDRTGRDPLKGDVVRYFIAGNEKAYKVRGSAHGTPSEDWKPGMENTRFYLKRLRSFADRFSLFFEPDDFARVFSSHAELSGTGDLFGGSNTPDFSGTEIVSRRVTD
jgi:DNA polymerase elongation subunit (family B)